MHRGDLGCDAVHGEDDVDQGQREDHQEERGDLQWEPEFPGFYVDVATRMVVFSGNFPMFCWVVFLRDWILLEMVGIFDRMETWMVVFDLEDDDL